MEYIETWLDEFYSCLLVGEKSIGEELSSLTKLLAPLLGPLITIGKGDGNEIDAEGVGGVIEKDSKALLHVLESSWAFSSHSFVRSISLALSEYKKMSDSFQESIVSTYSFEDEERAAEESEFSDWTAIEDEKHHEYEENIWYSAEAEDLFLKTPSLVPSLNVIILLVGSRGDIQPFIALAQGLREAGHNVRYERLIVGLVWSFTFFFSALAHTPSLKILLRRMVLNLCRLAVSFSPPNQISIFC
jgi:hypothetical protein